MDSYTICTINGSNEGWKTLQNAFLHIKKSTIVSIVNSMRQTHNPIKCAIENVIRRKNNIKCLQNEAISIPFRKNGTIKPHYKKRSLELKKDDSVSATVALKYRTFSK